MEPLLRIEDARKRFGETRALEGVSLELRPGELLGLLGPNGAGKTTLVRAISGRVALDAGTLTLFGNRLTPGTHREGLGVVPQELAVYPLLTARENLEAFGRLYGLGGAALGERVRWALEWTGLAERSRELVRAFSGGMKRRLNIACGVLAHPRAVLLDEPTVGVDPQSRERIYEMLETLRREGAALLLTTHQLEEAEVRCTRLVIVDRGHLIAEGTPAEIVRATLGGGREVVVTLDRAVTTPVPGLATEGDGTRLRGALADGDGALEELLARIGADGARVIDLTVHRPSLQTVFLQLTGRELRE
ncbi:MAG: ATP-binding cassette domain-containing protein [Candidatus Eisenbacteria bacterium]